MVIFDDLVHLTVRPLAAVPSYPAMGSGQVRAKSRQETPAAGLFLVSFEDATTERKAVKSAL